MLRFLPSVLAAVATGLLIAARTAHGQPQILLQGDVSVNSSVGISPWHNGGALAIYGFARKLNYNFGQHATRVVTDETKSFIGLFPGFFTRFVPASGVSRVHFPPYFKYETPVPWPDKFEYGQATGLDGVAIPGSTVYRMPILPNLSVSPSIIDRQNITINQYNSTGSYDVLVDSPTVPWTISPGSILFEFWLDPSTLLNPNYPSNPSNILYFLPPPSPGDVFRFPFRFFSFGGGAGSRWVTRDFHPWALAQFPCSAQSDTYVLDTTDDAGNIIGEWVLRVPKTVQKVSSFDTPSVNATFDPVVIDAVPSFIGLADGQIPQFGDVRITFPYTAHKVRFAVQMIPIDPGKTKENICDEVVEPVTPSPSPSPAQPSPSPSPPPSPSPSPVMSPMSNVTSPSPSMNVTSPSPSPAMNTTSPSPEPTTDDGSDVLGIVLGSVFGGLFLLTMAAFLLCGGMRGPRRPRDAYPL